MYLKSGSVVLIFLCFYGFLGVDAFQCYQCFGPPCNETVKVTCTEDSIKAGLKQLAPYYSFNSSSLKPPYQIQCLKLETIFASKQIVLGETATTSVFFKGCAVKQIDICDLPVSVFFRSEIDKSCNLCSGNLCNGVSSKKSSIFVVMGLVLLYKLLRIDVS
ncbi:hypothetical protein ACFFRR_004215 [Megaselia abdita]